MDMQTGAFVIWIALLVVALFAFARAEGRVSSLYGRRQGLGDRTHVFGRDSAILHDRRDDPAPGVRM